MTASLLLKLKGPMQSWGDSSRYGQRATGAYPTKSGVLGLVAAAEGRRRADPIEDLARLEFAVRVDQPGTVMRDYQTAQRWQTGGGTSLISRYYLADAVFVAAIGADDRALLDGIAEVLRSPRFPLFLGRRSCPANPDLVLGVREGGPEDALRRERWHAAVAHRKTRPTMVTLPILRDGKDGEDGDPRQDVPVSFDQRHRKYAWRTVVSAEPPHQVPNPDGTSVDDPFFEAVISA